MLQELLAHLFTPAPQYVRHMDYLREIIAMKGRYCRNQAAWRTHLEHSRRFVLSSAQRCGSRGKAVVLGSGLLLDLPLEELASMFGEVVLMDIVILPEVRRRIKCYGNVRLLQHDATGMAARLYDGVRRKLRELPSPEPRISEIDETAGLVVSLNILSQLWVMPRAYALGKIAGLDEDQIDGWCRQITESHYAFLRSLSCTVCLIADHEFCKRDRDEAVVSNGSTVYGLRLPGPDASWTWDIAPRGDDRTYLSKELTVGAWHFEGAHSGHTK